MIHEPKPKEADVDEYEDLSDELRRVIQSLDAAIRADQEFDRKCLEARPSDESEA